MLQIKNVKAGLIEMVADNRNGSLSCVNLFQNDLYIDVWGSWTPQNYCPV
jgi:hypothetical protein